MFNSSGSSAIAALSSAIEKKDRFLSGRGPGDLPAADGTLPTIAAAMTDMEQPDAFRRVAAGRAAFRTADQLDLLTLLDQISAPVEEENA